MRKFVTALLATLAMIVVALMPVPDATARALSVQNNPGSCSISGQVAYFNWREDPQEGGVKYISIRSEVRLNLATSAHIYNNDDVGFGTYTAVSSPVPDDGFWNYRINVNWVPASAFGVIDRIYMTADKYGSSLVCHTNIYG